MYGARTAWPDPRGPSRQIVAQTNKGSAPGHTLDQARATRSGRSPGSRVNALWITFPGELPSGCTADTARNPGAHRLQLQGQPRIWANKHPHRIPVTGALAVRYAVAFARAISSRTQF